jgi:gliding motility-associated transport system permease protein
MNAPVAPAGSSQLRALFRRELRSFFLSPISYLVWVVFLLTAGWLFVVGLRDHGPASLNALFERVAFLLLFVTPLLTMRLLADEHRLGTLEVLLTDPVRERTIVLAKYFAVLVFFVLMIAPTLAFPLILHALGEPDLGPIAGGYLGLLLLGALFLAIGLFCSAVTMNTIGAAALSFALLLLLWLLSLAADGMAPGLLRNVLEYSSAFLRYASFRRGVVDTRSLIWIVTLVVWMLTSGTYALALRRRR